MVSSGFPNIFVPSQLNMKNLLQSISSFVLFSFLLTSFFRGEAQVIISQYYEGTSTNKWIELTNLSSSAVNTASPQIKLGLWAVGGSSGNIVLSGSPTQTVSLNFTIPANGTVLIGNSGNGTVVGYLNSSSAILNSNSVINFNGNDGIALLDASNNIIDAFGTGINAIDISYVRNQNVTATNTTFNISDWTSYSVSAVNTAQANQPLYLGFHLSNSCQTPTAQPTNLLFPTVTNTSITGAFSSTAAADEYLVLRSNSPTLTQLPTDGTAYTTGNVLGNAVVEQRSAATTFTTSGLTAGTTYYFFIYSIKSTSCLLGPKYRTVLPLTGTVTTGTNCPIPVSQPTALTFTNVTSNSISAQFTASPTAEAYLVVRGNNMNMTSQPIDGVLYQEGNTIGNYTVIYRGTATSFTDWGLDGNVTYFYKIFAASISNCLGGIRYRTSGPLKGHTVTDEMQYYPYFGTLHSHSELSDGSGTVSNDMAYADAALCMDYLGISDHNHVSAGMSLANWNVGVAQAKAYSNKNFCALYGMEWGTISGGGHVLVYGTDSLLGWDPGEYQVYVPQNTYIGSGGLFDKVNTVNSNTFASLAHPGSTDFESIADTYNLDADMALIGCAVENGPSTSTNTTYSDYPASMAYLSNFRSLLARGYHIGPTIDHDNHGITHGRTAYSRTAVWASSLHRRHIIEAFQNRRFYATQDCGAVVNFKIHHFPMGMITSYAGYPVINVVATTSSPISSIRIMSGVPGSGTNATQVAIANNTNSFTYTHTSINNLATRYYYADITETDGSRIITAPIWYTRADYAIPTDGAIVEIRPGAASNEKEDALVLSPNPAHDYINISCSLDENERASFSLYDMYGRLVETFSLTHQASLKQINLQHLPSGIYTFTCVYADGKRQQGKITKR